MKRNKIILSVSMLLLVSMLLSVTSFAGRTGYEASEGAVVFNSPNTVSYFDKGGETNCLNITYDMAENAAQMTVTGKGDDPYALLSYSKLGINTLNADKYKFAVVTYKVPNTVSESAKTMEIFHCAGDVRVPTGGQSIQFALETDGAYHSYIVNLSSASSWSGTIYALRLDVFTSAAPGDVMYLDSVILAETASEATSIATYRQNKANGIDPDSSHTVVFDGENYNEYLTTDKVEGRLRGDVNRDKKVNVNDLTALRKYLVCYEISIDEEAADIDGNGRITIRDSLFLKKALAGLYDLGNRDEGAAADITYEDGSAALTALTAKPYVKMSYSPESETLYASHFRYIIITYKAYDGISSSASLYGDTSRMSADSASAHSFDIIADGTYHSAVIDMSGDSGWSGAINGFKFYFIDNAASGQKMYVDSVVLAETSVGASKLASYREATANGITLTDTYTLDISGQTLGRINSAGTYQNVGANYSSSLQPFSAAWPDAGWKSGASDTLLTFVSYNNYIKAADCVDLSKYSAVTITYATDNSFEAYNSEFGFFSSPTVFGQAADKVRNTNGLVFSVPLSTPVPAGQSNWHNQRSTTVSINSSYCGPLYLSYYMATGDGVVITDITFTLKTPEISESSDTLNNFKGSPAYTVSGDGKTVSVGGVTYPNAINYTSGVTLATDDVGRTLYTSESSGIHKGYDFENRNVGVFYFLWLGSHGNAGPYDIQKLVDQYGVGAYELRGSSPLWGPLQAMHFFAEPLYGYYFSNDEWVIRKHIEELTNADVDFLYFDVTNGVPYTEAALKVMKVIHEFNEMGYNPPKVVFYCNNSGGATGGVSMPQYLYNTIYSKNVYPDTWFCYEGKPVIIGKQSEFNAMPAAARNMFTFRQSQWPTEAKKNDAWSWMDFTCPAVPNYKSSTGKPEAINVSIAQHMGTIAMGDSGIYGYNVTAGGKNIHTTALNHGRNWHNGANDTTEGAYRFGYNFQEQWDTVHNSYPDIPIVLVTGWNEWVAGRQDASGDTQRNPSAKDVAWFVDTATVDFSRDIEMTRGYYFDNYYMQLISNVRKYKGASPTLVQDTRKRIDVTGSFDQWNDITVSYRDATGDTLTRASTAFGGIQYINNTGRNDIKSSKIVYDTEYAYFYVECGSAITKQNTNSSWMQLYIDADKSSSTGWYGYDYIVNYKAQSSSVTSLAKYTGEDGNYGFTETDRNISYSKSGNMMMIRVPLSELGITDYNNIDFSFKWVDSSTEIKTMEQMYTDGDQMPHGRLNYVFTNK